MKRFVFGDIAGRRHLARIRLERQAACLHRPVPAGATLFDEHIDDMFIVHITHGFSRWQDAILA